MQGLDSISQVSTNVDQDLCHHVASLVHNELIA